MTKMERSCRLAGNINGTLFPLLEQKFVFGNGRQHLEAFVGHSKAAAKDFVESWIVKLRTKNVEPSRSRYIICHGGVEDNIEKDDNNEVRDNVKSVDCCNDVEGEFVFLP